MDDFTLLFRKDGSPVGIGYQAGKKGKRGWAAPPNIRVDLGDKSTNTRFCRTINVCRTADFDTAWEMAVSHVLNYYGIKDTPAIHRLIRTGLPSFLARYDIKLKTVRVIDHGESDD